MDFMGEAYRCFGEPGRAGLREGCSLEATDAALTLAAFVEAKLAAIVIYRDLPKTSCRE